MTRADEHGTHGNGWLEHLLGAVLQADAEDAGTLHDKVFAAFLERQLEEGLALAEASDLVEILPLGPRPPRRYVTRYRCKGLVRSADGTIGEASHFEVGVRFPGDYLRRAEPFQVLTWLRPACRDVWHPNISDKVPLICIGRLAPGTSLTDIVYQCYEIISYQKVTMREDDAMNRLACVWARQNQGRFPIDRRPLRRRPITLALER